MQENCYRLGRWEGTAVPSPTSHTQAQRTHARALSNAIVKMHLRSPGLDRRCQILYKVWTSLVHVSFASFPLSPAFALLFVRAIRYASPILGPTHFCPPFPSHSLLSPQFGPLVFTHLFTDLAMWKCWYLRIRYAPFELASGLPPHINLDALYPLQFRTYVYSLVFTSACLAVSRSLLLILNPEHTHVDTGMFSLDVGFK
jgi:hypothetical protein